MQEILGNEVLGRVEQSEALEGIEPGEGLGGVEPGEGYNPSVTHFLGGCTFFCVLCVCIFWE